MTPQPPAPQSNDAKLSSWLFLLGSLVIISSLTQACLRLQQPAFPAAWQTLPLLVSIILGAVAGCWLYLRYRCREIRLPDHPLIVPVAGVLLCLLLTGSAALCISTLVTIAGSGKPQVYTVVALSIAALPPGLFWCWKLNLKTLREALSRYKKAE